MTNGTQQPQAVQPIIIQMVQPPYQPQPQPRSDAAADIAAVALAVGVPAVALYAAYKMGYLPAIQPYIDQLNAWLQANFPDIFPPTNGGNGGNGDTPNYNTIEFQVTETWRGRPIPSVEYLFRDVRTNALKSSVSDANGWVRVQLPFGVYDITANHPCFKERKVYYVDLSRYIPYPFMVPEAQYLEWNPQTIKQDFDETKDALTITIDMGLDDFESPYKITEISGYVTGQVVGLFPAFAYLFIDGTKFLAIPIPQLVGTPIPFRIQPNITGNTFRVEITQPQYGSAYLSNVRGSATKEGFTWVEPSECGV